MTAAVTDARPARRSMSRSVVLPGAAARVAGLAISCVALAAATLLSLGLGTAELELGAVFGALTAFDGSREQLIVAELRVPRTLVGLAVGAALGLAGVLMQGVTRNALAEPGILGINAGAAFGVVIGIAAFGVSTANSYVWFALVGAVGAAAVVYGLGSAGHGPATPTRLAMAGAVLASLLVALTSAVLVLDATTLDRYRFWIVGAIAGRDLDVLVAVLPYIGVGAIMALGLGAHLNVLSLGDAVARSLGVRVGPVRALGWLAVILLSGGAVAAAGPVAFVGLAVPHAVRILVGPDYRWIVPYTLVLGPTLLLVADVLGRIVARPGEVQVGIMTAIIGAPVFVWLVRRGRLAEV